jgi:hypothetical protein
MIAFSGVRNSCDARHFQFLYEVGQLGFVLFQFGDVGIGRDHAAVGGLAFAHSDPTTIAAALDVRVAEASVALEAFPHPSVGVSVRILYQSAIDGGTDNGLEAGTGLHDVRVRREQVPIAAVAYDELVVRIVQRETLRYALDRVGEAAPRFANFFEIRLFHLYSRCAEYGQGLGHAADFIFSAGRKWRFEIARRQREHAIAERSKAGDDIAPNVEPNDDDRTRETQHDGDNENPGAPVDDRKRRDVRAGNVAFGIFHQLVDSSGQASRKRDVLGQELCRIGREIELRLAQCRNAFGSADERTQLSDQIHHWLLQLGIKLQGGALQFA